MPIRKNQKSDICQEGRMTIGVIRDFHSAHWLNNYKGKCSNIHGHTWKVECVISAKKLNKLGMIIDFKEVKIILDEIISKLDHNIINFIVEQPTAENLAQYFYHTMYSKLRHITINKTGLEYFLDEIKIFETETNFCSYTYDKWFFDKQKECSLKSSERMKRLHADPVKGKLLHEKTKNTILKDTELSKRRSINMLKNNPMSKKENVEKMLSSLRKTLKIKPNKIEKLFIALCKNNNLDYKFVGDFSFFIDGKNPDFICVKENRIIEIFGRFWHSNNNQWYNTENDQIKRTKFFKDRGWKCLIIWDNELKDINKVLKKIKRWERRK